MGRLDRKVAIVTGGAGGIGAAIVARFLDEGARVAATVTSSKRARHLEQQIGPNENLLCVETEITSEESCHALAAAVEQRWGGIDILINNAGVLSAKPFEEITYAEWSRVIEVNLGGTFLVTRAVLPAMKRRSWGRVINVSSGTVLLGTANYTHYAASKAGMIGLTRCLASEVGQFGITVNAVTPGLTSTETVLNSVPHALLERRREQRASRRHLYPKDLVGTIVFLASDDAELLTGQSINVDGGIVMH